MVDDIKPHDFKAEITISTPAKNYDKAAQNIRNWEDEVQEAIGGLTFEINSLKRKGWPE